MAAPPQAPLPPGVQFLPSGVKFLPGPGVVQHGSVPVPVSAPKILGGGSDYAAPPVAAQSRVEAHGAIPALASATERASRAGSAAYNKASGGTQGVVAGMKASDLKALRVSAKKYPSQSEVAGSLVNPVDWGVQAVHGVKQIGQGAEKVAHGKLGSGAADLGLGALSTAAILPVGKGGKLAEALGLSLGAGRTAEEAQAHILEAAAAAKGQGFGKRAADVLVAPTHEHVAPHAPTPVTPRYPEGTLFHGSPEGELGNIDALYHTKMWREGPGFYLTTNAEKAAKYAAGKTASAERKTGEGALNAFRIKPEANVLNIDKQPVSFWKDMASKIVGEPITDKTWAEWARDIPTGTMSEGVANRSRLLHLLTGWAELPKTDAYYAIEEALGNQGVQATLHGENGVPVYVVKDEAALERVHPVIGTEPALSETERAAQVRGALEGAPATREAQKLLQSAERGKRFSASAAEAQKHEGVAAYHAAIGQLRGALPQINYKGFSHLDGQTLNTLLEDVKNHPTLMQGQKITAQRSLMRAIGEGKVPTAGEEKILRSVFGDAVTEQIKGSAGFFKTYKNLALDAANIPRAIMSSADLSAPLRQGLVGMVTHPVISLKAFPAMIKMFGSERIYQASSAAIENDPMFPLAMKAELPLTGIGAKGVSTSLLGREEAYQSNLAEKLNLREIKFLHGLGKIGTGPGDLIRASDRAYTGYLNQVRMDIFKSLVHDAAGQGRDVNDTKLLKGIARFVGSATGRGPLGPLKNHAVSINALFFSPKLLASRLDILLSPVTYLNADPFVRRQALEATFKLVGTMSLVLYAAKLGGAQVSTDPTNADFAKIRIGNTRIDIAGGFQQPVRLAFELAEGKVTSSTTGKSMALSGGIGKTSAGDVALRFLFSKAAPVPGFALQASGVSQASFGPKQSLWKQAMQKLLPLLAQDANDLRTTPGSFGGNPSVGKAVAGYGLGVFGVGEQTYAPKAPRNGSSGGWGSGGSGGSSGGWGDSGSGGTSGGWGS